MSVTFWGVRGGIACPGPAFAGYGGNTACVELRCGGRTLVFDAGTGIRLLGDRLVAEGRDRDLDLMISHSHVDHLIGLPFFAPAFRAAATIRLWTGHLKADEHLRTAIAQLMTPPLFPITPEGFAATLAFRDFRAGDGFDLGDGLALRTAPLNHPGGATAYRVDFAGRAFGYVTDHEAGGEPPAPALVALARGLDLLVVDASYTPDEIAGRRGWGPFHLPRCRGAGRGRRRRPAGALPPRPVPRRCRHGGDRGGGGEPSPRHVRGPRRPAHRPRASATLTLSSFRLYRTFSTRGGFGPFGRNSRGPARRRRKDASGRTTWCRHREAPLAGDEDEAPCSTST